MGPRLKDLGLIFFGKGWVSGGGLVGVRRSRDGDLFLLIKGCGMG